MLRRKSEIDSYAIEASDGRIGAANDFLFDDASWVVRWLVVDTGKWLSGKKVLLHPSALAHVNHIGQQFSVKLTMQQVRDSPDVDTDLPVSREMETSIYNYYGWDPPYWTSPINMGREGYYMGGFGHVGGAMATPSSAPRFDDRNIARAEQNDGDPHLRSIAAVTGYHIHASDGEIGHVEDFLVDDTDWTIRYLVVDTKNWWPGKKVLISPWSAEKIDWRKGLVNLGVRRQTVKDSPAYDPSIPVDLAYEQDFHRHHDKGRQSGQSGTG